VVVLACVVVPLVFIRSVRDSFDISKALVVSLTGALLLPIVLHQVWGHLKKARVTTLGVAAAALVCASVVVTATSRRPWNSLWGQYQRYTGLITILSCASIAFVVAAVLRAKERDWVVGALILAQFLINLYAWIQLEGSDPFQWASDSFSRFVFSSLGNPNTASAFSVITLPLTVYWLSQFRHRRYLAVFGATVFVTTIFFVPVYNSFQGNVGLVGSVVALIWLVRSTSYETGSYLLSASLVCSMGSLLWFAESRICLVVCLLVTWLAILALSSPQSSKLRRRLPVRWRVVGPASSVAGLLGLAILWPTIRSGVENGLSERRFFYSAMWELFKRNPVLGTGLDTFGFFYPQFRPEEHARTLEGSITSSVHSIPLGMFASGGLLLGLSFVALMIGSLIHGTRRVFRDKVNGDPLAPFATASLIAFLVISTVSVESIHLFFLASAVVGLTVSSAGPLVDSVKPTKKKRGDARAVSRFEYVLLGSSVLIVALSAPFLSRYFRADKEFLGGVQLLSSQVDQSAGLDKLRRAAQIAPWEASYRAQYAQALAYLGDPGRGAEEALRAAKDSNYVSTMAPTLAQIVLGVGRFDEGFEILDNAIERDPFAPGIKLVAADLYRQVADYEVQQGLADAAAQHRARADELTALAG